MTRGFVELDNIRDNIVVFPPPDLPKLAEVLGLYGVLYSPESLGVRLGCEWEFFLRMHRSRIEARAWAPVEIGYATYGRRTIQRLVRFMDDCVETCHEKPNYAVVVAVRLAQP